jgi:hypothetical protein
VNAAEIEAFLDDVAAAGLELHGLMIHRHGAVAAENFWWPYGPDRPRVMHSATKSFTACAIGMAVEEGRLSLSDRVIDFFPDHLPAAVDAKLAAMTVEDLLTMRTGHERETSGAIWRGIDTSWIAEFFKIPIVHEPGTTYVYTSAASYMLSAVLTRVTGETLHDYLKPRLFEPLGITGETWDTGPDGVNPGGNGLTCRCSDLLKLCILYTQGGLWDGRRILSEDWVRRSTVAHGPGYGYHWVIGEHGSALAVGVFVQIGVSFPEQGASLMVIGAINGSKLLLPHLFRHFPLAFETPGDAEADRRLEARFASTRLARPLVSLAEPAPEHGGTVEYAICENTRGVSRVRFEFAKDRCRVVLTDAEGDHTILVGIDRWIEGQADMPGRELHHGYRLQPAQVVAGGRWLDADTLEMTWIYAETAFRDTVVCRFGGGRINVSRSVNVNSGATSLPELAGHKVRS